MNVSNSKNLAMNKTKLFALTLITLIIAFNSYSQTKIDSSKIVKVLSFNILHGKTMKGDFNLDIIAKGYDLESGEVLDLSQNLPNKKCSWNKWNST